MKDKCLTSFANKMAKRSRSIIEGFFETNDHRPLHALKIEIYGRKKFVQIASRQEETIFDQSKYDKEDFKNVAKKADSSSSPGNLTFSSPMRENFNLFCKKSMHDLKQMFHNNCSIC
uniref:Uncharacterized protein n=1 Tax=Romanomermis culicivorax TaxID=13658 RepID=A0A915K2E3_ROMCU